MGQSAVPYSRDESMDVVMAVNMGADDYLTKPVSMEVLLAKVRAMLRRSYDYEAAQERPSVGRAALDSASSSLRVGDARVPLTKNELRILSTLLQSKGKIVGRDAIMLALWDSDAFVDDNTLSVNMARLRKTLDSANVGATIVTHKGQGYSIHDEDADRLL